MPHIEQQQMDHAASLSAHCRHLVHMAYDWFLLYCRACRHGQISPSATLHQLRAKHLSQALLSDLPLPLCSLSPVHLQLSSLLPASLPLLRFLLPLQHLRSPRPCLLQTSHPALQLLHSLLLHLHPRTSPCPLLLQTRPQRCPCCSPAATPASKDEPMPTPAANQTAEAPAASEKPATAPVAAQPVPHLLQLLQVQPNQPGLSQLKTKRWLLFPRPPRQSLEGHASAQAHECHPGHTTTTLGLHHHNQPGQHCLHQL